MTRYLPIIIASVLLAFAVTPLTRVLARRIGMIDQPGLRKAHRSPIPLLGGLAIYLAVTLAFLTFGIEAWLTEGIGILAGATLLFLTGLWDDRFGMPVRLKLAAQAAAALVLIVAGVQVRLFDVWWLDWPITLVWVVGITNAANLMDNMDGLAAGISAVAGVFFFVLAALEGQGLVASLAAALFGSALGFLFYNFAPAVSFMGDAGSLTLGYMLAVIGIKLRFLRFPLGATWMVPIVVLGVLIFDTTLVCVSRWRRGRSIFQGGSDHTSHRLVQVGMSAPRAVLTLYVVAAALGAVAVFLTRSPAVVANTAFGVLVLAGLAALIVFERVEPRLAGDPPLVVIPGGGGFAEALRAALGVSRNVTVLLAPQRTGGGVAPARAEIVETIGALAEDRDAVHPLLERGLGEDWWADVNRLNRALKLAGSALVLCAPADGGLDPSGDAEALAEALAAIRKARLILLGPGDPEVNLTPALSLPGVAEAVRESRATFLYVDAAAPGRSPDALKANWLAERLGRAPEVTSLPALPDRIQVQLLGQAAGQAKTQT